MFLSVKYGNIREEDKRKQHLEETEQLIGNRCCDFKHEFKRVFSFDGDNILFMSHEGYEYTYYSFCNHNKKKLLFVRW